jgi:hypothetical protein
MATNHYLAPYYQTHPWNQVLPRCCLTKFTRLIPIMLFQQSLQTARRNPCDIFSISVLLLSKINLACPPQKTRGHMRGHQSIPKVRGLTYKVQDDCFPRDDRVCRINRRESIYLVSTTAPAIDIPPNANTAELLLRLKSYVKRMIAS